METKPKVLKWALIIGIVIVLNLFFNYAISLFYKAPDYNSYFPQQQVIEPITTKEACLAVGGQWNENGAYQNVAPAPAPKTVPVMQGFCNQDFTKQQQFNEIQKAYERNVFLMLVVLGVISFIVGAFLVNEILTLGLSWGGALSFLIASVRYWSTADNLIKVLILAIALAVLIWLAVKKFGNGLKEKNERIQS